MPVANIDEPKMLPGEAPASVDRHHNEPPVEERIQMEFRDQLLSDRPDFMQVYDALIAAADRAKAEDDETLGKCGDLVKRYRAAANHIDECHKGVKAPYLEAGRACDAEKNRLRGPIDEAARKVNALMNAYVAKREAEVRAERDRIAAEERAAADAAREAGEGEVAALAPAAPKKVEPVRSDGGATVSTREVWNSRVDDYAKAMKAVKSDPKVKEAIDAAVARLVRAGQREIAGVTIWSTQQAVAR